MPAAAKEPPTTVRTALLSAAFHCHGTLRDATKEPILLVTGTGNNGEQTYAFGKGAFEALGHPVCDVDSPDDETADIQISVQYLVYAIRREFKQSGREIAVFAISQGGLLARFALTYWPDLRSKVTDVVAAAGTVHGTTLIRCSATRPCAPAVWQQRAASHLLRALDAQPLEAPGPTAWTNVRSSTDEVFTRRPGSTPARRSGEHPTSSSAGSASCAGQPEGVVT